MQDFMDKLISMYVRKEQIMEKKEQKKSYICYVYGQIYAEYLHSGKGQYIMVKNTQAQTWKRILQWFKEHNHIGDFQLGDTPETAGAVVVKGFNEDNMIYKKYCQAVKENFEKAIQEAL